MDDRIDGVERRALAARLPIWVCAIGVIFFVGAGMLFARLLWEETVWTWDCQRRNKTAAFSPVL